jgi:hypothetical protein
MGTRVPAGSRLIPNGTQHYRSVVRSGRFRWSWALVDEARTPVPVLASGRAWTRRRAWKQVHRAYERLLVGAS